MDKLKAVLYGAGQGGTFYPDFGPFTLRELSQNFGLYILHGISPSPTVKMKVKAQCVDFINRNYFVLNSFGSNSVRCHRNFK